MKKFFYDLDAFTTDTSGKYHHIFTHTFDTVADAKKALTGIRRIFTTATVTSDYVLEIWKHDGNTGEPLQVITKIKNGKAVEDPTQDKAVKVFYDQIERCNYWYTGGNIYLFNGKLKDGTYFFLDGNTYDVRILKENFEIENDDCYDEDWQESRLIRDLDTEKEGAAFTVAVVTWLENNYNGYFDPDLKLIRSDAKSLIGKKGWR